MTEYILISLFIVTIFWGLSYLKGKYLTQYKWGTIVTDIATFILFFILFVFPKITKNDTSLSQFRIILLVILSCYFLFKIYKDMKLLKK